MREYFLGRRFVTFTLQNWQQQGINLASGNVMADQLILGLSPSKMERDPREVVRDERNHQGILKELSSLNDHPNSIESDRKLCIIIRLWLTLINSPRRTRFIEETFYTLIRKTTLAVLTPHWGRVDESLKRELFGHVMCCGQLLNSTLEGSLEKCHNLKNLGRDPWGNIYVEWEPLLAGHLCLDDPRVRMYLSVEPEEIALARVHFLIVIGCEDHALCLVKYALKYYCGPCVTHLQSDTRNDHCEERKWDAFSALEWFLFLLQRKKTVPEVVKLTEEFSCHEGLHIVKVLRRRAETRALGNFLVDVFISHEVVEPKALCCTKTIFTLWCSVHKERKTSISDITNATRKLLGQYAPTSAHFYMLVDTMWEQFGQPFLLLYMELFIRGFTVDINHLEVARSFNMRSEMSELEAHLATMFTKLSMLFSDNHEVVARECVLSAFSLRPNKERLLILQTLTHVVLSNQSQRTINQGHDTDLSLDTLRLDGEDSCFHCGGDCADECQYAMRSKICHPLLMKGIKNIPYALVVDLVIVLEAVRCNVFKVNSFDWHNVVTELNDYLKSFAKLQSSQLNHLTEELRAKVGNYHESKSSVVMDNGNKLQHWSNSKLHADIASNNFAHINLYRTYVPAREKAFGVGWRTPSGGNSHLIDHLTPRFDWKPTPYGSSNAFLNCLSQKIKDKGMKASTPVNLNSKNLNSIGPRFTKPVYNYNVSTNSVSLNKRKASPSIDYTLQSSATEPKRANTVSYNRKNTDRPLSDFITCSMFPATTAQSQIPVVVKSSVSSSMHSNSTNIPLMHKSIVKKYGTNPLLEKSSPLLSSALLSPSNLRRPSSGNVEESIRNSQVSPFNTENKQHISEDANRNRAPILKKTENTSSSKLPSVPLEGLASPEHYFSQVAMKRLSTSESAKEKHFTVSTPQGASYLNSCSDNARIQLNNTTNTSVAVTNLTKKVIIPKQIAKAEVLPLNSSSCQATLIVCKRQSEDGNTIESQNAVTRQKQMPSPNICHSSVSDLYSSPKMPLNSIASHPSKSFAHNEMHPTRCNSVPLNIGSEKYNISSDRGSVIQHTMDVRQSLSNDNSSTTQTPVSLNQVATMALQQLTKPPKKEYSLPAFKINIPPNIKNFSGSGVLSANLVIPYNGHSSSGNQTQGQVGEGKSAGNASKQTITIPGVVVLKRKLIGTPGEMDVVVSQPSVTKPTWTTLRSRYGKVDCKRIDSSDANPPTTLVYKVPLKSNNSTIAMRIPASTVSSTFRNRSGFSTNSTPVISSSNSNGCSTSQQIPKQTFSKGSVTHAVAQKEYLVPCSQIMQSNSHPAVSDRHIMKSCQLERSSGSVRFNYDASRSLHKSSYSETSHSPSVLHSGSQGCHTSALLNIGNSDIHTPSPHTNVDIKVTSPTFLQKPSHTIAGATAATTTTTLWQHNHLAATAPTLNRQICSSPNNPTSYRQTFCKNSTSPPYSHSDSPVISAVQVPPQLNRHRNSPIGPHFVQSSSMHISPMSADGKIDQEVNKMGPSSPARTTQLLSSVESKQLNTWVAHPSPRPQSCTPISPKVCCSPHELQPCQSCCNKQDTEMPSFSTTAASYSTNDPGNNSIVSENSNVELQCLSASDANSPVLNFEGASKKPRKKPSLECQFCGKLLCTKYTLKMHTINFHTGDRPKRGRKHQDLKSHTGLSSLGNTSGNPDTADCPVHDQDVQEPNVKENSSDFNEYLSPNTADDGGLEEKILKYFADFVTVDHSVGQQRKNVSDSTSSDKGILSIVAEDTLQTTNPNTFSPEKEFDTNGPTVLTAGFVDQELNNFSNANEHREGELQSSWHVAGTAMRYLNDPTCVDDEDLFSEFPASSLDSLSEADPCFYDDSSNVPGNVSYTLNETSVSLQNSVSTNNRQYSQNLHERSNNIVKVTRNSNTTQVLESYAADDLQNTSAKKQDQVGLSLYDNSLLSSPMTSVSTDDGTLFKDHNSEFVSMSPVASVGEYSNDFMEKLDGGCDFDSSFKKPFSNAEVSKDYDSCISTSSALDTENLFPDHFSPPSSKESNPTADFSHKTDPAPNGTPTVASRPKNKPATCDICKKTLCSSDSKKRHMRNVHKVVFPERTKRIITTTSNSITNQNPSTVSTSRISETTSVQVAENSNPADVPVIKQELETTSDNSLTAYNPAERLVSLSIPSETTTLTAIAPVKCSTLKACLEAGNTETQYFDGLQSTQVCGAEKNLQSNVIVSNSSINNFYNGPCIDGNDNDVQTGMVVNVVSQANSISIISAMPVVAVASTQGETVSSTPKVRKASVQCSMCDKVFCSNASQRRHLKNVHKCMADELKAQEKKKESEKACWEKVHSILRRITEETQAIESKKNMKTLTSNSLSNPSGLKIDQPFQQLLTGDSQAKPAESKTDVEATISSSESICSSSVCITVPATPVATAIVPPFHIPPNSQSAQINTEPVRSFMCVPENSITRTSFEDTGTYSPASAETEKSSSNTSLFNFRPQPTVSPVISSDTDDHPLAEEMNNVVSDSSSENQEDRHMGSSVQYFENADLLSEPTVPKLLPAALDSPISQDVEHNLPPAISPAISENDIIKNYQTNENIAFSTNEIESEISGQSLKPVFSNTFNYPNWNIASQNYLYTQNDRKKVEVGRAVSCNTISGYTVVSANPECTSRVSSYHDLQNTEPQNQNSKAPLLSSAYQDVACLNEENAMPTLNSYSTVHESPAMQFPCNKNGIYTTLTVVSRPQMVMNQHAVLNSSGTTVQSHTNTASVNSIAQQRISTISSTPFFHTDSGTFQNFVDILPSNPANATVVPISQCQNKTMSSTLNESSKCDEERIPASSSVTVSTLPIPTSTVCKSFIPTSLVNNHSLYYASQSMQNKNLTTTVNSNAIKGQVPVISHQISLSTNDVKHQTKKNIGNHDVASQKVIETVNSVLNNNRSGTNSMPKSVPKSSLEPMGVVCNSVTDCRSSQTSSASAVEKPSISSLSSKSTENKSSPVVKCARSNSSSVAKEPQDNNTGVLVQSLAKQASATASTVPCKPITPELPKLYKRPEVKLVRLDCKTMQAKSAVVLSKLKAEETVGFSVVSCHGKKGGINPQDLLKMTKIISQINRSTRLQPGKLSQQHSVKSETVSHSSPTASTSVTASTLSAGNSLPTAATESGKTEDKLTISTGNKTNDFVKSTKNKNVHENKSKKGSKSFGEAPPKVNDKQVLTLHSRKSSTDKTQRRKRKCTAKSTPKKPAQPTGSTNCPKLVLKKVPPPNESSSDVHYYVPVKDEVLDEGVQVRALGQSMEQIKIPSMFETRNCVVKINKLDIERENIPLPVQSEVGSHRLKAPTSNMEKSEATDVESSFDCTIVKAENCPVSPYVQNKMPHCKVLLQKLNAELPESEVQELKTSARLMKKRVVREEIRKLPRRRRRLPKRDFGWTRSKPVSEDSESLSPLCITLDSD